MIRLNVGCGEDLKKDYINVDLHCEKADVKADARYLPFDDCSAIEVFASHLIEHFPPHETVTVLTEWIRVLRPGGILTLIYPDTEKTCRVWLNEPARRHRLIHNWIGTPLWPGHQHYWCWWGDEIEKILSSLGLVNISSQPATNMPDITDTCTKTIAYKPGPTYSIIIPVYNQLEWLKKCLASIKQYTKEDYEILIVSNGSNDETNDWIRQQEYTKRIYIYDEPLGYARANNVAIPEAYGEYIILLNSDTEITGEHWISMLREPFAKDSRVGIVGPTLGHCSHTDHDFIIFFCAMIKREVFDKVGLLDESFKEGGGDDTSFSIEAVKAGYRLAQAGEISGGKDKYVIGNFPIYHEGEATMHSEIGVEEWGKIFERNSKILEDRYLNPHVTVVIPTRNRYDYLSHTLGALARQTYNNFSIIIIDDTDDAQDIRTIPLLAHQLALLDRRHIQWKVVFGKKKGPQWSHQMGLQLAESELILRVDDDEYPERQTIGKLVQQFKDPKVAAAGGLVMAPSSPEFNDEAEFVAKAMGPPIHIQHFNQAARTYEVQHLTSSFMFRKSVAQEIGGYFTGYSRVGHREETDFTYRMFHAGYKLIVDTDIVTWHFQSPSGGIRSNNPAGSLWAEDDKLFWERVKELVRNDDDKIFVPIFAGVGDHIATTAMLQALRKSTDKQIVVGASSEDILHGNPNIDVFWPLEVVSDLSEHPVNVYERGFKSQSQRHLRQLWYDEYGLTDDDERYSVFIPQWREDRAREFVASADGPLCLIVPYSAVTAHGKISTYKDWEDEKWRALIRALKERGYQVNQLGVKGQETDLGTDQFLTTHILDAIALVKHASLVISVDTWAGHAAHAFGTKAIILFGSTNPALFGYPTNINICKGIPDPNIQWLRNENVPNDKMRLISVEDVINAIEEYADNYERLGVIA